jgi:flagellar hook protein FlgE
MSFQTGLSGLSAASQNLDVIGNNIANANTVGMKSSRGEFADLVASAIGAGGSSGLAGIGTAVAAVSQNFSQGNVNITGNALDVAINGGGFYQLTKTDGSTAYSRAGQFKLDKDGNIITNTGSFLMGYPTDVAGNTTSFTTGKLSVPTGAPIAAKATSTITAEFNLDARAPLPGTPGTTTTATQYGTSLTAYDSQGVATPVSLYFVKTAQDTWGAYDNAAAAQAAVAAVTAHTQPTGQVLTMHFNTDGSLNTQTTTNPANITLSTDNLLIGAPATPGKFTATIDISKATQYGVNFAISSLSQNGYTSGEFTGLSIDNKGVITTRYSNGQTQKNGGMIALADFRNVQGLDPTGSGEYQESFKSGAAVMGQPTVGRFGELRAGAVEESNVDLTAELVNMMTAQRNYQANAQTIKTQDQIMSTLVNLR